MESEVGHADLHVVGVHFNDDGGTFNHGADGLPDVRLHDLVDRQSDGHFINNNLQSLLLLRLLKSQVLHYLPSD